MPNGNLILTGTLDLAQFWPDGRSDADTAQIEIGKNAFQFRASPSDGYRVTNALDDAIVFGADRSRHDAVTRKKDGTAHVTVRFQGIDAPELHYRPPAEKKKKEQNAQQHQLYLKWNEEYRQHWGQSAAQALGTYLRTFGAGPLRCTVETRVDAPDEVFDMYGRMIGDLYVERRGKKIDLNHWLVEQGLATPTFYNSMDLDEIDAIIALAKKGARRGLRPEFKQAIVPFDVSLIYKTPSAKDTGSVMLPKIFRRQAKFEVNKRARMATGTLLDYLKGLAKNHSDKGLHLLGEFRSQGATAAPVYMLCDRLNARGLMDDPTQLVFREDPSTIRTAKGKDITSWW
jgi:endonuclease YncB( thermonuclease family)